MKNIDTLPVCRNNMLDCFANRAGRCICLGDTNFGSRCCPFYKTTKKVLKEDPRFFKR